MGHKYFYVLLLFLPSTVLHSEPAQDAVLNLKPNWSVFYTGQTLTITCDTEEPVKSDWKYTFNKNDEELSFCTNKSCSFSLTKNSTGKYWCTGRHGDDFIESDEVSVTVKNSPKPRLNVSSPWLKSGSSVTLNCSTNLSAEWRFFWYKAASMKPDNSYHYELLPGGTGGASFTVDGHTHTAGYVCRAGRGDSEFYTYYSKPTFLWSGDSSRASVKLVPDKVQHFPNEPVSLRCEGTSSEWRVMRVTAAGHLSNCSAWGIMKESTCLVKNTTNNTAVFWCESASGLSNAVNITKTHTGVILVGPVHPVTEGEAVTLFCKTQNTEFDSSVRFYRNDQLIQDDTREELHIPAVSLSDEGFYKCESSGRASPPSWMTVKPAAAKPEGFSVQKIIGLVFGLLAFTALLLILLLWFRRRIKSKSEATPFGVRDDGVTYAEVTLHNRDENKKDDEGTCSPAAMDETVYSEVKV